MKLKCTKIIDYLEKVAESKDDFDFQILQQVPVPPDPEEKEKNRKM